MVTVFRNWPAILPIYIAFIYLFVTLDTRTASALNSSQVQLAPIKTNDYKQVQGELLNMSLREKIGQLFIFGFRGTTANEALSKTIATLRPGGIIVFGRNIVSARQVATLIQEAQYKSLQSGSKRLLVAVDHEGGNVIRVKTKVPLPSAMALGVVQDLELTKQAGVEAGKILSALGFNMNLAPVLDLSPSEKHSFIGTRTFGSNPTLVASHSSAYSLGLSQQNIIPTAKHFPGHGDTLEDSHLMTPTRNISIGDLFARDLIPYQKFSSDFPYSAIMLGHVLFPKVDAIFPATYSRKIVTNLLRERMSFNGMVITDDLEMTGASQFGSVGERAVQAILAGADLCMIGWNPHSQREAVRAVFQAVKNRTISMERIDQSITRILMAKKRLVQNLPEPQISRTVATIESYSHSHVADRTLEKIIELNVSKLKKENFHPSAKKLIIVSASYGFSKALQSSLSNTTYKSIVTYSMSANSIDRLKRVVNASGDADLVLLVSGSQSAQFASALMEFVPNKIVLVNTESEGIFKSEISTRATINIYFKHPALGVYIGRLLNGLTKHVALAENTGGTNETENRLAPISSGY